MWRQLLHVSRGYAYICRDLCPKTRLQHFTRARDIKTNSRRFKSSPVHTADTQYYTLVRWIHESTIGRKVVYVTVHTVGCEGERLCAIYARGTYLTYQVCTMTTLSEVGRHILTYFEYYYRM